MENQVVGEDGKPGLQPLVGIYCFKNLCCGCSNCLFSWVCIKGVILGISPPDRDTEGSKELQILDDGTLSGVSFHMPTCDPWVNKMYQQHRTYIYIYVIAR